MDPNIDDVRLTPRLLRWYCTTFKDIDDCDRVAEAATQGDEFAQHCVKAIFRSAAAHGRISNEQFEFLQREN